MSQSQTNLIFHIVFSTKNRDSLIADPIKGRLFGYFGGAIRKKGGILLAAGGVSDHVHILAKLRPDDSVSNVVRDLKANSSGWIHKTFPEMKGFSWQNGYGGFTVSASQVEKVRRYVLNQEAHHSKQSFKVEFVKLLEMNDLDFDEKYLFS